MERTSPLGDRCEPLKEGGFIVRNGHPLLLGLGLAVVVATAVVVTSSEPSASSRKPPVIPADLVVMPEAGFDMHGYPLQVKTKREGIVLRWVPWGSFRMGSGPTSLSDDDERPSRIVYTKGFYVSAGTVDNAQYERFDPDHRRHRGTYSREDDTPATRVSFDEAKGYIRWLCEQEGVSTNAYRLMTEAEAEKSARAGAAALYSWGCDEMDPDCKRAYSDQGALPSCGGTKPNAYGIYHATANVFSWVSDWYGAYPTTPVASINPKGPSRGKRRCLRGGTWHIYNMSFRCADRWNVLPDVSDEHISFRIVREIPDQNDPVSASMTSSPAVKQAFAKAQAAVMAVGSTNFCYEQAVRALQERARYLQLGSPESDYQDYFTFPNFYPDGTWQEAGMPFLPSDGTVCFDIMNHDGHFGADPGTRGAALVQDLADKLADEHFLARFARDEGDQLVFFNTNNFPPVTGIATNTYPLKFQEVAAKIRMLTHVTVGGDVAGLESAPGNVILGAEFHQPVAGGTAPFGSSCASAKQQARDLWDLNDVWLPGGSSLSQAASVTAIQPPVSYRTVLTASRGKLSANLAGLTGSWRLYVAVNEALDGLGPNGPTPPVTRDGKFRFLEEAEGGSVWLSSQGWGDGKPEFLPDCPQLPPLPPGPLPPPLTIVSLQAGWSSTVPLGLGAPEFTENVPGDCLGCGTNAVVNLEIFRRGESTAVPEPDEEREGAVLSRNNDDDNGNDKPDVKEKSVTSEDDLIKVVVHKVEPKAVFPTGTIQLACAQLGSSVAFWDSPDKKKEFKTLALDTEKLPDDGLAFYVERTGLGDATITATYLAKNGDTSTDVVKAADGGEFVIHTIEHNTPTSKELPAEEFEKPGAFVPLNNDDDDDSSTASSMGSDKEQPTTGAINGEDDLLPIIVKKTGAPPVGALYEFRYTDGLRLFQTANRTSRIENGGKVSIPASTDLTLFVEGFKPGAGRLELWYKSSANANAQKVQGVTITVFNWQGPLNVPQYSFHQYTTVDPGTFPKGSGWTDVVKGTGTLIAGKNTLGLTVQWDVAPKVGLAVFEVNKSFIWDFQVNVVEVKVATPNARDSFIKGLPLDFGDDVLGGVRLKSVVAGDRARDKDPGLDWAAEITLTAPAGHPNAVRRIKVGFIQNLIGIVDQGVYNDAKITLRGDVEDKVNDDPDPKKRKALIDVFAGGGPWYLQEAGTVFFDAGPGNRTKEIKTRDFPRHGPPLTAAKHAEVAQGDDIVDLVRISQKFQLDICANTKDDVNDAEKVFTRVATATWEFIGDGRVAQVPGYGWTAAQDKDPDKLRKAEVTLDAARDKDNKDVWKPIVDGSQPRALVGDKASDVLAATGFQPLQKK